MTRLFSTVVGWSHLTQESCFSPPSPAFTLGRSEKALCSAVETGRTQTSSECALRLSLETITAGRSLSRSIRQTSPRRGYQPDGLLARFHALIPAPRTGRRLVGRPGAPHARRARRRRSAPPPQTGRPCSPSPTHISGGD